MTADEITMHENDQIDAANASDRTRVVFVHGLWLLPSSWDRWLDVFRQAGYAPVSPGWPDDPETVAEARQHPEVFAKKSIGDVADHFESVIRRLSTKPAIVGHSFGGLLTQIMAARGTRGRVGGHLPRHRSEAFCPSLSPPSVRAPRCSRASEVAGTSLQDARALHASARARAVDASPPRRQRGTRHAVAV